MRISRHYKKKLESALFDGQFVSGADTWYHDAKRDCGIIADHFYGWSQGDVINLAAIFSPRVAVKRSIALVVNFLSDPNSHPGGLTERYNAATAYCITGYLGGPKVVPFARSIHEPDHCRREWICIDTHMATLMGIDFAKITPEQRIACQNAIATLGDHHRVPYAEIQSVAWCGKLWQDGRIDATNGFADALGVLK